MKIQVLREGNWIEFIVPPMRGEVTGLEAVRVTGRLASTRGGNNYNWDANFNLPSAARFEPFVRLEFRGEAGIRFLGWHQFSSLESVPQGAKALSWGGSLVDAPALVWGQEVIDLSRRAERRAIVEAAKAEAERRRYTDFQQGRLLVQYVPATFEQLAEKAGVTEVVLGEITRHPVRPLVVFNHAVFVNRVVGYDTTRLIEVEREAVITSPDHPFEPLRLGPGVWLLSHPLPAYDQD